MSCRANGAFAALNYPAEYPFSLAAKLVVSDKPDPDKVRELISKTRRIHEQACRLAAEVNELRGDKAILERTIALLSVSDEA